jgi:L-asparaginase
VRRVRAWPEGAASAVSKIFDTAAVQWPRVEIVMSHAGASGAVVEALVQAKEADPLRGLVLAATGNGTLHHALEEAALKAQAAGIAVVRATRCVNGRILPKAGDQFRDAGALTPVKARIALMLELFGQDKKAALRKL